MTFGQRTAWSHDPAWQGTPEKDTISWRKITETLPDGNSISARLGDPHPGRRDAPGFLTTAWDQVVGAWKLRFLARDGAAPALRGGHPGAGAN